MLGLIWRVIGPNIIHVSIQVNTHVLSCGCTRGYQEPVLTPPWDLSRL